MNGAMNFFTQPTLIFNIIFESQLSLLLEWQYLELGEGE